jgi:hypothetical protein
VYFLSQYSVGSDNLSDISGYPCERPSQGCYFFKELLLGGVAERGPRPGAQ